MTATDERTAERIVGVAGRLFAERGYRNVTVREIAREAGVTHPLIYHHFGSKRGLLAAALAGTQNRMRAIDVGRAGPREAIVTLIRENLIDSRAYVLTLARALLDDLPTAEWPGGFPTVERLLDLLGGADVGHSRSDQEVRETAAVVIAMAVGWMLLEDPLLDVFRLPPEDCASARETLLAAIDRVIEPLLSDESG